MNICRRRLAIALTAALVPGLAAAQHEAHQSGASQADVEQCARAQPVVNTIIAAAMARLELARQSNSPAEMRAAVDHLEAALRDIRAQLTPCSAAPPAAGAEHGTPGPQQRPGASAPGNPAPESGADPHAGHTMPPPAAPSAPLSGARRKSFKPGR